TAHNIGQLLAASFIVRTNVFSFYIPYLLISGIITGFLIGITGSIIIKRVKLNTFWSKEL
ncbi:MAG: Gx transporter family protein, partial [Lachnospiraceae bacterium]|nr:Gx transporter family protein [Lachnospiraceae bacterium]